MERFEGPCWCCLLHRCRSRSSSDGNVSRFNEYFLSTSKTSDDKTPASNVLGFKRSLQGACTIH